MLYLKCKGNGKYGDLRNDAFLYIPALFSGFFRKMPNNKILNDCVEGSAAFADKSLDIRLLYGALPTKAYEHKASP